MKKESITLKDGTVVIGDAFDKEDLKKLQEIFSDWLVINKKTKSLGGRGLNVPDVFSEALFCLAFNAIRTNGTAYSYDCVMRETGEGVQIKSASIKTDCTSFGPTSTWDLLYFVDFIPNDTIDGKVYIYKIEDDDIYNAVLNSKKNETFKDQQKQGRRPRLSIQNIIRRKKLKPVKVIDILSGDGL